MNAPDFWNESGWKAWLLAPISWVYGFFSYRRLHKPVRYKAKIPVLCIGNLVAGGAGKTPTALALAKAAKARNFSPVFLTRGYGGALKGPVLVDLEIHRMAEVGDEALLLAQTAPTIVAQDRVEGAKLATNRLFP